MTPLHLLPIPVHRIWGGKYLSPSAFDSHNPIGESWQLSFQSGLESLTDMGSPITAFATAAQFPLLIKIIDAAANLSVQVHPDDKMAHSLGFANGKTEMWHIIDAQPGAKIYAGFKQDLTPEQFLNHVAQGTIFQVMNTYDSQPGDTFFIPAGTIHAIGAGNLLAEIQQDSDLTFRIFDYGRGRELHITQALQALNLHRSAKLKISPAEDTLVACEKFSVRQLSPGPVSLAPGVPVAITNLITLTTDFFPKAPAQWVIHNTSLLISTPVGS